MCTGACTTHNPLAWRPILFNSGICINLHAFVVLHDIMKCVMLCVKK
jgi:hypothetical protein